MAETLGQAIGRQLAAKRELATRMCPHCANTIAPEHYECLDCGLRRARFMAEVAFDDDAEIDYRSEPSCDAINEARGS